MGTVTTHYWTLQNIFEKSGHYKEFREKNIFFIFSRVNFRILKNFDTFWDYFDTNAQEYDYKWQPTSQTVIMTGKERPKIPLHIKIWVYKFETIFICPNDKRCFFISFL
jgi:hypothetical protein